jgi:uncharacterized membrane protein YjjB (DUF3815 family)
MDREQAAELSGKGSLFGVPLGDLGWFASLLMGTALGFAAFFAATFLGIMGILVYNTAMHGSADFAWSYRRVGLPVGATVMALALGYLGTLWARRQLRRS